MRYEFAGEGGHRRAGQYYRHPDCLSSASEIDSRNGLAFNSQMLHPARNSQALNALSILMAVMATAAACDLKKPAFTYPPDTLPVRYEPATAHSTCLVAAVVMATNYLLGERRFTEQSVREDLKGAKLDETSIEDLKTYLSSKGLYLVTLSGQIDGKPPASLRYWLEQRRYPVICVINRKGEDLAYNHAVVVTGIEHKDPAVSADKIVYLDPSASLPLQTDEASAFDALWQRGQRAMMIVVAPPTESQPAPSSRGEHP